MASSVTGIIQRLQARPIRNFSVSNGGVAASGLSSLNALPPSLRQRYVDAINAAMQQAFGIEPIEIFWNERAKQAILAHPNFLDKLSEGFDPALELLPEEIEVVIDSNSNKLYFFAARNAAKSYEKAADWADFLRKAAENSEKIEDWREAAGYWKDAARANEDIEEWKAEAYCYARASVNYERVGQRVEATFSLQDAALASCRAEKWEATAAYWKEAAEACERVGEGYGDFPDGAVDYWEKAAKCYERTEQWKEVRYCRNRALKVRPERQKKIGQLTEAADSLRYSAKDFMRANEWEKAVNDWKEASKLYGIAGKYDQSWECWDESEGAYKKIANSYIEQEQWGKAADFLKRVAENYGEESILRTDFWREAMALYEKTGQQESAADCLAMIESIESTIAHADDDYS